jgi:curved DNA-binding protein CbpA
MRATGRLKMKTCLKFLNLVAGVLRRRRAPPRPRTHHFESRPTTRWRILAAPANLPLLSANEPDHYATLGLDRRCAAAQIRDAYRLLAKQHHPDVNGGCAKAAARTRELNEAYEILGDAERRMAYDQQRAEAEKTRPRKANFQPDIAKEIHLRIEELLRGTTLEVRVLDPGKPGEPEIYPLTIPPGTAPGARFRIARVVGGFVRVKVRVQPDFRFKARGSDLRCDLRIRAERAAQGGTESVRGATGNYLRVDIPRGVARGEIVRIEGEGLPKPRGGRGDLLVRMVYNPEVRISRPSGR